MRVNARLLLLSLLGTLSAATVQAQSGALRGRIVDATTGAPLAGATITNLGSGKSAKSDSTGGYRVDGVAAGLQRFMVAAPGFPRSNLVLAFAKDEVMERDLALDSTAAAAAAPDAQRLGNVTVAAEASRGLRFRDFERRKSTGRGQYLTSTDIDKAGFYNLQDAMRNLRGVQVSCGGGSGCFIHMARAPMGCSPEYIVDERVDNMFGPQVPIRDIEGIEVYTGPSDVAGEFAGTNSGCGVIVIWTKAGPPTKKKNN
jgi:hypothetical protein